MRIKFYCVIACLIRFLVMNIHWGDVVRMKTNSGSNMICTIYTSYHPFIGNIHTARNKSWSLLHTTLFPIQLQSIHPPIAAPYPPSNPTPSHIQLISLPPKPLLQKIHLPLPLPLPNRLSHIIPQPPRSTNPHSHRPNLLSTLHLH